MTVDVLIIHVSIIIPTDLTRFQLKFQLTDLEKSLVILEIDKDKRCNIYECVCVVSAYRLIANHRQWYVSVVVVDRVVINRIDTYNQLLYIYIYIYKE